MSQFYLAAEKFVPPEEPLTPPTSLTSTESSVGSQAGQTALLSLPSWTVVARNRRVNRDWEELLSRFPENARRCYEDLCHAPMTRKPGRVFPLKGKLYKGVWEYEVTSSERVFYIPDPQKRQVMVYYAGEHPKKNAPLPTQG